MKFCHKAHVRIPDGKRKLLVKIKFYSNTDGPRDRIISQALGEAVAKVRIPE